MARIIQTDDHLQKDIRKARGTANEGCLLALLGVLLVMLGSTFALYVPMAGLAIVAGFALMAWGSITNRRGRQDAQVRQAGLEGEKMSARMMAQLPDGYTVLQNLSVEYEGKTSELDLTIVGPTGVFVVETKNHVGYIWGEYDGQNWGQQKVSGGGVVQQKGFYSPVKQVGTHVYRLAKKLRSSGFQVHVNGAVLFTNPRAEVHLQGTPGNIPVFAASDNGYQRLIGMILTAQTVLTAEQASEIVTLLSGGRGTVVNWAPHGGRQAVGVGGMMAFHQMQQNQMFQNQIFQNQMFQNQMQQEQMQQDQLLQDQILQEQMLQDQMLQNQMLQDQMIQEQMQHSAQQTMAQSEAMLHGNNSVGMDGMMGMGGMGF